MVCVSDVTGAGASERGREERGKERKTERERVLKASFSKLY